MSSVGQLVTGLTDGGRGNQFRTGSPGALSSGGCGLARPIVPGCAPLLTCLVSTPSIAEYDGKDNHDGSAGVSVCRLLRIVFHGCLPKGARNNVTWLSWFRLPGRQYQGGGQISWSASGENTDGFLHTHIANSESSRKLEIYRPNTWPHRPSLRREDFSCQPGAVHTWHFSDSARCLT